jgi:hypothetical protein
MKRLRILLVAAGALGLVAGAGAQQAPQKGGAQKAAPAKPPGRVYYDIYEPLQRTRLKKESCMKDEDSVGAYCVKKCMPSYELKSDIRPMRCQGTNPLPPGVLPGPIRTDIGTQPMPVPPAKPRPEKPGA